MNRDDIRISKKLSYFLRHGAVDHKINIRPDGFVYLDELLKKGKLKASVEKILGIVENNDKKRFEMVKEDVEPFRWKIRAVQGHTLRMIDQDKLLTRIGKEEDWDFEVYTSLERWGGMFDRSGENQIQGKEI